MFARTEPHGRRRVLTAAAMKSSIVSIELTATASIPGALALIAPILIETDFQSFGSIETPRGWDATIVAEPRSGQRAVVLRPPSPTDRATFLHGFSSSGPGLSSVAFVPEGMPITTAAAELVTESRKIAHSAGGGLAGIEAIVADTSARFSYGEVPIAQRWYFGKDEVPIVACTSGNCIDINTYLGAALRAAGYEAAYLTC